MSVPDQFGSPRPSPAGRSCTTCWFKDHQLSPRPALIGMSRGALYCMAWAAAHPDRTLLVYLDNGVCDFKSWPGGRPKGLGTGQGLARGVDEAAQSLQLQGRRGGDRLQAQPVDNLAPLAGAKIPILLVYGDNDRGVPHSENSQVVYDRYKALGGPVERIVKPGQGHHPHGLTDPTPIVGFFEKVRKATLPE